jgi:hypothetical protein
MKGAGPVCWATPPSGWVECGMGAAKSKNACAKHVTEQTGNTLLLAAKGAAAVGTLGGSVAATEAQQGATNAGKIARLKSKIKAMKEALNASKTVKALKAAKNEVKAINEETKQARKVHKAVEDAKGTAQAEVVTEADIARLELELASLVDPSGATSTAASFSYPKCSELRL